MEKAYAQWNPKAKVSFPKAFLTEYHPPTTQIIHRDIYWEWLSPEE